MVEAKLQDGLDLLIGMDVISQGDMSITNFNGNTVMSFRVPSKVEVDFVSQLKRDHALERKTQLKQAKRGEKKQKRRHA